MTTTTSHTRAREALCAACALLLLAAAGCRNDSRQPAGAAAPEDRGLPGKDQSPYYHGLIEEYRAILGEDPHNLAAIIALGNALYDAGQWEDAVRYYEKALRLNPHLVDVITDMGTCYRNLGMPDRAIQEYLRALRMEPAHENALFNLGVVYGHDKKEYARAVLFWEQLLQIAPNHPRAAYVQETIATFRRAMRRRTP
jgi:tetratricopeptide (TPR) repeat protein